MSRDGLLTAFRALARTLREPVSLTLGGSSALILTGALQRPTADGDVIESSPDLGRLSLTVRQVEAVEEIPAGWLNGSIQSYAYVLPPDYRARLVRLPPFDPRGLLTVSLLSRQDVILMKVFGQRPRDVQDVVVLRPTPNELAFVEAQIPRIARHEPEKAQAMRDLIADLAAELDLSLPSAALPAEAPSSRWVRRATGAGPEDPRPAPRASAEPPIPAKRTAPDAPDLGPDDRPSPPTGPALDGGS